MAHRMHVGIREHKFKIYMSIKEKLKGLNEKPDLIFIITDQERATMHFPEGWEEQNLKSMTFLKNRGFSFDKAFCNTCMCSPSRSTLLTGTYPAQHQVTETLTEGGPYSAVEIELDPQYPNLARMLEPLGYDCQWRGKWHLSKGSNGEEPLAKDIALFGFKGWVGPDAGEDAKPENFGAGFASHDEMYIKQAIEYLETVRVKRAKGYYQPYCLVLSLVNPHDVLAYPNNVQYGYQPWEYSQREVDLPQTWNENLTLNKKPLCQPQTNIAADGLLGALTSQDMKLDYINFYAYLLKKIDSQIGQFLMALYKDSMSENALVIRLADHGEMGMAHGGMRQKAFVAYEETLRVPMVISNPKLFAEKQSSQELASLIDILPTIAEITGAIPPIDIRGTSLLPIIDGGSVQDEILFTFDDTKSGSSTLPSSVKTVNRLRTIRTKDWKYSFYFDSLHSYEPQYELYDLNDTSKGLEYTNLAYDPAYKTIREDLHSRLEKLMIEKLRINAGTFSSLNWKDTNSIFDNFAYKSSSEELKSAE